MTFQPQGGNMIVNTISTTIKSYYDNGQFIMTLLVLMLYISESDIGISDIM